MVREFQIEDLKCHIQNRNYTIIQVLLSHLWILVYLLFTLGGVRYAAVSYLFPFIVKSSPVGWR